MIAPLANTLENETDTSGDGFNHYARRRDIDLSVITGEAVVAICGTSFKPTLRVGSSGKADEPGWPKCPRCVVRYELLAE